MRQSSIAPIQPIALYTRAELVQRYRRFRAISKMHNNGAQKCMSWDAFRTQARRLGIVQGKTFVLNAEDELAYVCDLALYGRQRERKRPLDRYASSQRLSPNSDEARVLEAMLAARFALLRVERRHPEVGLIVYDLARDEELWLLDEGLEKTAPLGFIMATRVYSPEDFFMAAGVFVPLDSGLLMDALASITHLLRKDMNEAIDDRRFAEAIYREALHSGVTERIRFEDPETQRLQASESSALGQPFPQSPVT